MPRPSESGVQAAVPRPFHSESEAWLRRDEAALAPVLRRLTDVVAVRGQGSWIWDADGRRYLDFASGIAVTTTGHCHPRVVAAIEAQARRLLHTSVVAHLPPAVELAERLRDLAPMPDARVFFCNSGAEAVDGALKLARRVTGRGGVIAFRGAFHGRTLAATSLTTSKQHYREGYEPLLPGVAIADYGGDPSALCGPQVGAMIVEPVLGEGGYLPPPDGWLQRLRELCDAHGILLIFDEVQCGVGRTGRMWAAETFGVVPDVLLFAKGIASGMPLGGILARRELMERWPPGAHGSTFGGNPVSCAAALATLDVIRDENLCERARLAGQRALRELRRAVRGRGQVRGVGLMIGIELGSAEACEAVRRRALDAGLIVLPCGPEDSVLRLCPPLTLTDDELEMGLEILRTALRAVP